MRKESTQNQRITSYKKLKKKKINETQRPEEKKWKKLQDGQKMNEIVTVFPYQ